MCMLYAPCETGLIPLGHIEKPDKYIMGFLLACVFLGTFISALFRNISLRFLSLRYSFRSHTGCFIDSKHVVFLLFFRRGEKSLIFIFP